MQRDREYLLDILEAAKLAVPYTSKKSKEDFFNDSQCQDAVIRRLEVIGEAARRISEQTRNDIIDLPWIEMVGMRNVMIHEYDDIDIEVVWDTVRNDLPPIIVSLGRIIKSQEEQ